MPVNNNTSANSIDHEYIYDIIIVGGGISGLYMARKCLSDGLSVLLLEKEDRLGGRIHTKYNQGPDDDLRHDS
jgi:phytoene dehydrogenase-like protein